MTDCREYQELISELVDGELAEPQKTGLESHIASCPECRQVYQAFALISSSLENDMAEPPEDFARGVMDAIRASAAPPARKPRRFARVAALAAVLGLIILAGSRFGVFTPKGAANGAMLAATAEDSAAGDVSTEEGVFYSLGVAEKELPSPQAAPELAAPTAPEPAAPSASDEAFNALPQPEPSVEAPLNDGGETSKSASSASVRVFAGSAEPIAVFTDAETMALIMDILAFGEAGDDIALEGGPTFVVEVDHGGGALETINAYIIDGRLCCVRNGTVYVAAGDVTDLIAMIAAA